MSTRFVIDTNLLVLLVVGQVSPEAIETHKRLGAFSTSDFELLKKILTGFRSLIVTPSALSEVSNLVGYGVVEPLRSQVMLALAHVIKSAVEVFDESRDVSKATEFRRLGLADSAWLAILDHQTVLLTDDTDLYLAALSRRSRAFNFAHVRKFGGLQ